MVAADVAGTTAGLASLRAAVTKGDLAAASGQLNKLKVRRLTRIASYYFVINLTCVYVFRRQVSLTCFTALPPIFEKTPTAAQEFTLARALAPVPAARGEHIFNINVFVARLLLRTLVFQATYTSRVCS